MCHLLIILDRKEFEERLTSYYWNQPRNVQRAFLASRGTPVQAQPVTELKLRAAITGAIVKMSDMELAARCQLLIMAGESA